MAKGKYIMTSDDDGQTPVGMVWDFYDKIQEGYDVVCAKYKETTQKSRIRRLGTELNEFMMYHMIDKPKSLRLSSCCGKKICCERSDKISKCISVYSGTIIKDYKQNCKYRNQPKRETRRK